MRALAHLAIVLALTGCGERQDGPLRAVIIGDAPRIVEPGLVPPRPADAILMNAAAEGLVRLDAGGQIEPGLAERWNVSDDGLSYMFRLGDRRWPDGGAVTARQVVRQLRAAAQPRSRNPIASVLSGIDEIVATTDEVLEIRLRAPRPNLLYHLTRPELAIVRDGAGAGPFAVSGDEHGHLRLTRTLLEGETERTETVMIAAARPALAVALFAGDAADLVLGGTLDDLPIARAARLPGAALRIDPAVGLLGLAVVDTGGALAAQPVRRALAMAIDRAGLVDTIGVPGLQPSVTLVPAGLSSLPAPAVPDWASYALPARQAEARRLLASVGGDPVQIRLAMPGGPGYRLVFAHLKRDWAAIGVDVTRVDLPRSADLRLVDAVAPSSGASWYLERHSCARTAACDPAADVALAASRSAADARTRTGHFAAADRLLTDAAVFIPLTTPVRWSLVDRRVRGFRENPFAVHGLADLLRPRR